MNGHMIKQLIYRDFRAYRRQIITLSIFILVMSMFVTFVNTNTLRIFTAGIGNIIMIIIGSFAVEQSNSAVRMHAASLPVSRREIVTARFITSMLIVLINTIIHFIVFNLFEPLVHTDPQYTSASLFIYAIMFGTLQLAIYNLIFFRVNLVVAVIIFVLPAILWSTIAPGAGFMGSNIQNDNTHLALFSVGAVALLVASYHLTVRHFSRKDL